MVENLSPVSPLNLDIKDALNYCVFLERTVASVINTKLSTDSLILGIEDPNIQNQTRQQVMRLFAEAYERTGFRTPHALAFHIGADYPALLIKTVDQAIDTREVTFYRTDSKTRERLAIGEDETESWLARMTSARLNTLKKTDPFALGEQSLRLAVKGKYPKVRLAALSFFQPEEQLVKDGFEDKSLWKDDFDDKDGLVEMIALPLISLAKDDQDPDVRLMAFKKCVKLVETYYSHIKRIGENVAAPLHYLFNAIGDEEDQDILSEKISLMGGAYISPLIIPYFSKAALYNDYAKLVNDFVENGHEVSVFKLISSMIYKLGKSDEFSLYRKLFTTEKLLKAARKIIKNNDLNSDLRQSLIQTVKNLIERFPKDNELKLIQDDFVSAGL